MNCKCGLPVEIDLELTGGCQGHSGDDDYCYCDGPEVRAYGRCRNPNCRVVEIAIPELSDQYLIAKWLTKHYFIAEEEPEK